MYVTIRYASQWSINTNLVWVVSSVLLQTTHSSVLKQNYVNNDARVKRACIITIRSRDLWISGPKNNHCADNATDVAVGDIYN